MDLPFATPARQRLGEALYRYVLGRPRDLDAEAPDANEAAFSALRLVPRVMRGCAAIDIQASLFGYISAGPLAVGPFAGDRLFHAEGLLPVARVCQRLVLPLLVSEETVTPLADITATHDGCWLQLRAAGPLDRARRLADVAARCGARGLVLTALAPAHPCPGLQPGGFDIDQEIARRGWSTVGADTAGVAALPAFPHWGWDDVAALATHLRGAALNLVVKGILHPADATAAFAAGCQGVVVANVGLRQSGRWALPLRCLAQVRSQSAGAVLLDGGVRNGADVVVACCLGADFAVATRPVVTTLAGGGEAALESLLRGWLDEVAALASWLGVSRLTELEESYLCADAYA